LFRDVEITTQDSSFGVGSPQTIFTFKYAQESTDQTYIPSNVNINYEYLTIAIRTSGFVENYTRYFDTVATVIAVMGEYWSTVVMIISLVAIQVNKTFSNAKLANDIYKIKQDVIYFNRKMTTFTVHSVNFSGVSHNILKYITPYSINS